jgi:sugar fermentation stimulation protein A
LNAVVPGNFFSRAMAHPVTGTIMEDLVDPIPLPLPEGCKRGVFKKREKRFLVLVDLDGQDIWVHTNNSGSMLGLLRPGREVVVSPARNPKRKLPYTLEMIRVDGVWIGVNTLVPNQMLKHCFTHQLIPEFQGYASFQSEVRIGKSRLDGRLEGERGELWVEAKNVTLVEDQVACFPDAVTIRGQKHLQELMELGAHGARVGCFYLVQREDARCFAPADFIDPVFAELFYKAAHSGVEAWPYLARATPMGICLVRRLEVLPKGDKRARGAH